MSEQAPGWYGDPRGPDTWRWWDGSRWTSWLSREADGPQPPASPVPTSTTEPGAAPVPETGPRVSRPLAVVVVAAATLVGVLVVGLVVWASQPRLSTGPAIAPPPPQVQVTAVTYTAATRSAQIAEAKLTLPAEPYACDPAPVSQPPVFTSLISCSNVVHGNYNPKGDDWSAVLGFGLLDPSVIIPGDLTSTGELVFKQLRTAFFRSQTTKVEKFTSQAVGDIGSDPSAQSVFGNVTYRVTGLPSTYDRLVVFVIPLESGDVAVAYSDRPNDLPKPTLDRLNASLGSLTARR